MASDPYDDDPLWKRIFLNEFLWAILAIICVMFVAFHFATEGEGEDEKDEQRVEQQD